MTRLALLFSLALAACNNCPAGTSHDGQRCVPAGGGGTSSEPVSEENFQRRFNTRRCQAAEQCLLDEGYDPDFWDVICDEPTEWDESCPFQEQAAEACLEGDWGCEFFGFSIYTEPPAACDQVYACEI